MDKTVSRSIRFCKVLVEKWQKVADNPKITGDWLVSFMHYDLGYFDQERDRVEPGPSPFAPDKV